MKKSVNKIVCSFLILLMLMGVSIFTDSPINITEREKVQAAELLTLEELKAKFPAGKYWNHLAKNGHGYNEDLMCTNCGNPDGWTNYPCAIHGVNASPGKYDCNGWYGQQCNGFVRKLATDAYGSMHTSWAIGNINSVKPGDVIHYYGGSGEMAADPKEGHWVMVIAVNGDVLTFGECNSDGHCKITWHRTMNVKATASRYTVYSAPWALEGGTSSSTVNVGTGFYAYIINTDQWRHLTNDGNNVSLRTETGKPNQVWYFERLSNGDYKIKSVADNKYLEVANNSSATGANVQTGTYDNQSGEQWCIYGESGRYVFGVRCSNCVLELKDHSTAEGANICVNTPWDTVRQYWQIWKLDNYVQATSVTLNKTSITLNAKGATASLTATVSPSNTTDKSVSYSSSNTSIATVDANGKVTAVGNGTATITVATKSGARTATCKVTVNLKPEADGWYYTTVLPSDVTSAKYEIQYQNIYEKYATSSPGTGWKDTGVDKRVETKDGAMYELGYPIATSETVRLEGYYYYHWCGPNAGANNVNYESRDAFVHLDRVSSDRAWEYASYTDPDDSRYTYYYLKWSDNSDAYCLGNSTCSEGHAERSYYWYKSYMYQNYKIENLNLYQKTSNWGTSKDSSAVAVNIRYRVKPTSVSLNKTTATLTSKGATVTLTATIAPTDAGCKNVTWKSSNTAVATVSSTGVVTAVGNGTATITVTTESGGKTATCKVTVSIAPTGVTLNKTNAVLTAEGQTVKLTATVSPSNAADKSVTWKSSNTDVATVDNSGKVTAVGNGIATITVTTVSGNKTANCDVTVRIAVTDLSLDKVSVTLEKKGDTIRLNTIVSPYNAANQRVVWSSSDTTVATVENNGKVIAVGYGRAVITATTTDGTDLKATCEVIVKKQYKDGINLYTDGKLYYFKDNEIDTSYNGVADYENETWYVANGKVDTSKSGVLSRGDWYYFKNGKVQRVTTVASNKSGWWYIENGEVNFEYDGVGTNGSGTWYIENGKVDFNKTGVLERAGKWYYFNGGKVQKVTTVANNKSGWWYIENGEVNFEYDGVGTNGSGTWYIENGKVDFNKTGLYMRAGERYYFRGGKVDATMDGVISVNGTWYLFEQGKINNTTTVASNKSGWWYIENGEVNFEYDGVGTNGSGTWYIENGKVDFNKTGVLERAGKWYYFNGGKVQKVTTVANNKSGWWYIENGEVNFEYDGVGTNGSGTWYIENGKVDFNKTGVLERAGKWYYFNGGKVQRVTTVASNKSGCWYIESGEVNFEYTGIYKDSNGNIYNIKNGRATLMK